MATNLLWVQKGSLLLCQPILKLWQKPYSPQHTDVGLKYRHHDVIIQPYIRHHSPHRFLKLHLSYLTAVRCQSRSWANNPVFDCTYECLYEVLSSVWDVTHCKSVKSVDEGEGEPEGTGKHVFISVFLQKELNKNKCLHLSIFIFSPTDLLPQGIIYIPSTGL